MTNRAILQCLTIGLAAFIAGILAGQFRLPPLQDETAFARSAEPAKPDTAFVNSDELNLSEIRLVCNDALLRPFWNDLLQEFSNRLFTAALQPSYDCSELLKVEEIDLNGDRENEFVVTIEGNGLCSNTGNCRVAIYRRGPGAFPTSAGVHYFSVMRMLYDGGAISYTIERTRNEGYPNLLLRENGGNYEDYLREYEFDGRYYRPARCYGENKQTLVRFEGCD
jgi:hypothetical protein